MLKKIIVSIYLIVFLFNNLHIYNVKVNKINIFF